MTSFKLRKTPALNLLRRMTSCCSALRNSSSALSHCSRSACFFASTSAASTRRVVHVNGSRFANRCQMFFFGLPYASISAFSSCSLRQLQRGSFGSRPDRFQFRQALAVFARAALISASIARRFEFGGFALRLVSARRLVASTS